MQKVQTICFFNVTESFRLDGTLGDLWSTCSKHGELGDQTRLLWAFSSLVLETSKDKDCTAVLGKLFHCLIVLTMEKFFFNPVRTCLVSTHTCCLSCSCYKESGSIFLITFLSDFRRLLLDPPLCLLFSSLNKPSSLRW